MADRYNRKQILLKREDGTSAGFLRLERVGNRCGVEVQVPGQSAALHAVLLGGGKTFPLGKITRNRTIHAPNVDEMQLYNQAAVLTGDVLLCVGGDGADFRTIRAALAKPTASRSAKKIQAAPPSSPPEPYALPYMHCEVEHAPETHADSRQQALEASAADNAGNMPDATTALPDANSAPLEGWVFKPYLLDTWEYYAGQLLRDGQVAARMHAVAGTYAPEPPPGLTGFVWDSGFWVRVEPVHMNM